MKYTKITLPVLLTALLFAGCNDWFDVKPKTEIRSEDLLNSEEGFWEALTGVYINMAKREAYGGYLSWEGIEFMAWQHKVSENNKWYPLQRRDYTDAKAMQFIDDVWKHLYNVIAEANYLLYALDEYGSYLRPAVYNNIKAQCLGIRAYCHFDLMRLFAQGNLAADPSSLTNPCIPYVTAYSKVITPQVSYDSTLTLAMEDIAKAMELFNSSNVTQGPTMMNRHALNLLAARIELWRGRTEAALPYTEGIMSLFDNYWARKTYETGIFPSELVFCLSVYNLFSWTQNQWDYTNTARLVSVTMTSLEQNIYMINAGVPNYSVDESDLRFTNWYKFDGNAPSDDEKGHESIKVQVSSNSMYNLVGLMRMTEAWLIAAECELAKGTAEGKAKAIELVNYLRENRGNTAAVNVAEDIEESELKQVILIEQLREFSQEGQAFFLYKRLGITDMVNAERPITIAQYLLPYPQSEQQVGHTNNTPEDAE